jgi:hypothetical protein
MQDDEKDELGEALYDKIMKINPDSAAKLTGMMLDSMEASQLKKLLKDDTALTNQVEEALNCLETDWEAKYNEAKEELEEAESWASGVQQQLDEWAEKEQRWSEEKEDLTKRLSRLESAAEASNKSSDKAGELSKKAEAAEKRLRDVGKQYAEAAVKRLRDVEKQNVKLEEDLKKSKERASKLEESLEKAGQCAKESQAAVKEAQAVASTKPEANGDEKKSNEEVSMADRLKGDMVAKYKADLAAKEEELARIKAEFKQVSTINGNNGKHKNGSDQLALEQKLQEAEASVKTHAQRAAEAEKRSKEVEEELETLRKADRAAQSKSEKSRELQQDLEQAHKELKSFKAQNSKAQQEISDLKKKLKGAGVITESPKAAEPPKKEPSKQKEAAIVAQPAAKRKEVEQPPPEEIEEEEEDEEPVVEEPKKQDLARSQSWPGTKVQATSAAKTNGKKKGGAVASSPTPAAKNKQKSSFKCSGTHVVAGCLALVVMIQAGLFIYESLYSESLR